MSPDRPFFSILIPSFNRPFELKRCIESVLQSSNTNFEIIVSDDNSPLKHEIEKVMLSFSDNPKVRFFQQPNNLREPGNKNYLVSKANGNFNIVIGDDDVLGSNSLNRIYDFVIRNPHYNIYGLGYCIVNENNKPISNHVAPRATVLSSEKNVKYLFEFGVSPMSFMHPATFCCRSGVELALPYREDVGIGEDLCFLLQAVAQGHSLIAIPLPLFNWRKVQDTSAVQQGNQSAEHLSSFRAKCLTYKVLEKEKYSNLVLKHYISSPLFRFKFIYLEVLRDPLAINLTGNELGIRHDMCCELVNCRSSLLYKVRIRCRLFFSLIDLCNVLGFISTLKYVVKSITFRMRNAI
jgi:glycosyltransferase involved in cell wall biosynthesis